MYSWKFPRGLNELATRVFIRNVTKGFWGARAKYRVETDGAWDLFDVRTDAQPHRSCWEVLHLISSEVAEAGEAIRDGMPLNEERYELSWPNGTNGVEFAEMPEPGVLDGPLRQYFRVQEGEWVELNLAEAWQRKLFLDRGASVKPVGVPSELADVIIRVLDACGAWGIDIVQALDEKMAYNDTRPPLHGRAR